VVDDGGTPVLGAWVWVTDPVHFGDVNGAPMLVEGMMSGSRDSFVATTDARGRFAVKNLEPREYHVQAMSAESLARSAVAAVSPDSGEILLTLPEFSTLPDTVDGRIVARDGKGVPEVAVVVTCEYFKPSHPGDDRYQAARQAIVTDGEGRFSISCVPHESVSLRIEGDRIVPREIPLADDAPRRGLEIVVSRRCHLRLELGDTAGDADRFGVLDADGNAIPLSIFVGVGRDTSDFGTLEHGVSEVLAVDETARTLVLYRDDVEVRREPLDLVPGKLNVVSR
jgi:hypothetical protein